MPAEKLIISWSEPFDRPRAYVLKTDIPVAIQFLKQTLGGEVTRLYLNPMYLQGKTSLNYPFPENIEVVEHTGVACWEIWGETTGSKKTVMTGEILVRPEKAVVKNLQDTTNNPHNGNFVNVISRVNEVVPPDKNKPVDFDCSASLSVDAPKIHVSKVKKPLRHGILGRPEKLGSDVSPATLYRRRKKLGQQKEQGVLL
jgi:hypothetical protein